MNIDFTKEVNEIIPDIIKHRRHLHSHPELSYLEVDTSDYIQNYLKELNIPFQILFGTGVVGLIGNSDNCVALRADIDALPIDEETGLEFSSTNAGVMHACGHDMHMAMLLGAASILKKHEKELQGSVKLIFQLAEEKLPGGAIKLIEGGVLSNPKPKVILAQHVNPGESVGKISLKSGSMLAATDELYITIKGKGSHAAQPHLGNDTISCAAQLIIYFQSMINKFRNPLYPSVLSITSIHGGSATNIFPETVELKGTLRTFQESWREECIDLIKSNTIKICELFNTQCEVNVVSGYPSTDNDDFYTNKIIKIASNIIGESLVINCEPYLWAEDFSYYGQQIPAVFWLLGVRPMDQIEMPALHSPKFSPSEEALTTGTLLLAQMTYELLKE